MAVLGTPSTKTLWFYLVPWSVYPDGGYPCIPGTPAFTVVLGFITSANVAANGLSIGDAAAHGLVIADVAAGLAISDLGDTGP